MVARHCPPCRFVSIPAQGGVAGRSAVLQIRLETEGCRSNRSQSNLLFLWNGRILRDSQLGSHAGLFGGSPSSRCDDQAGTVARRYCSAVACHLDSSGDRGCRPNHLPSIPESRKSHWLDTWKGNPTGSPVRVPGRRMVQRVARQVVSDVDPVSSRSAVIARWLEQGRQLTRSAAKPQGAVT